MTDLLIVYHSRTGGSKQMAEAAFNAAASEAEVKLLRASETRAEDLISAKAYLFVAPENLAALSGEMKEFFDRNYYAVLGKIEGRAYAQMVCAGSDGEGAARQIARIAKGWRLKEVQSPIIICTHAQTPEAIQAAKQISQEDLAKCRELGQALAVGVAMGAF